MVYSMRRKRWSAGQYRTTPRGLVSGYTGRATRAVLPYMRRQRSGHVINMSSIGGYASSPGWGVYCATKFAVEALTESLAVELAPLGIHATVVEPGYFRTDFLDDSSLVKTKRQIDDYAATTLSRGSFQGGQVLYLAIRHLF